jgi:hypothetical protein
MMEAVCSSKILVNSYWTTQHYIPENSTLHNHCYENLKSNIKDLILFYFYETKLWTIISSNMYNILEILY